MSCNGMGAEEGLAQEIESPRRGLRIHGVRACGVGATRGTPRASGILKTKG